MRIWLQNLRTAQGLSRERLAARIGVCSKTIERWESGESDLKLKVMQALAGCLGVDVSDVISAELADHPQTEQAS